MSDVVRLNEPEYDAAAFRAAGIAHHDLEFEDCSSPPDAIAAAFLRIAGGARGLVAVHCKAGLGRTGTLIALYLMRSHGFTARAAMGWLRIVRPGCVIGEQQQYLCDTERRFNAAGHGGCLPSIAQPSCRAQGAPLLSIFDPPVHARAHAGGRIPAAPAAAAASAVAARQVAEAMNRRAASRIAAAAGR